MTKHRRTRMSSDGIVIRTRSFNCCSTRGGGGDGDDDSMEDYEDEDEVLEQDNGSGQEEEEEEEQQHLFQQDHVDVTNFLNLLNRSVTPPLRPESY
jgi:hypothetical protein